MLYKVTPAMEAPRRKKTAEAGEGARKRRKTSVYDADGNEVLISLMCLKCRTVKPLAQFGLRRMADGAMRNQPWCKGCRGASVKKEAAPVEVAPVAAAPQPVLQVVAPPPLVVHEVIPRLETPDEEPTLGAAISPVV